MHALHKKLLAGRPLQPFNHFSMALLSSKTLIQAHALFLFVLAVYLTRSPEVVTESDLVFMLGEFLNLVCLWSLVHSPLVLPRRFS